MQIALPYAISGLKFHVNRGLRNIDCVMLDKDVINSKRVRRHSTLIVGGSTRLLLDPLYLCKYLWYTLNDSKVYLGEKKHILVET
jgi:hypothetical protein